MLDDAGFSYIVLHPIVSHSSHSFLLLLDSFIGALCLSGRLFLQPPHQNITVLEFCSFQLFKIKKSVKYVIIILFNTLVPIAIQLTLLSTNSTHSLQVQYFMNSGTKLGLRKSGRFCKSFSRPSLDSFEERRQRRVEATYCIQSPSSPFTAVLATRAKLLKMKNTSLFPRQEHFRMLSRRRDAAT